MRKLLVLTLSTLLCVNSFGQVKEFDQSNLMNEFYSLAFEENAGQFSTQLDGKPTLFVLKDRGMTLFFHRDGITFRWHYFEKPLSDQSVSEASGLPVEQTVTPKGFEVPDLGPLQHLRPHCNGGA